MRQPKEGKTKRPKRVGNGVSRFVCKDDVTAGNGARHEVIPGKGKLVARTVERTARLLASCEFPVAFIDQDSADSYLALNLGMIPVEAVARRFSAGSMPKRHPDFKAGYRFERPVVELFLKTRDKVWKTPQGEVITLPCDDPYMLIDELTGVISLHDPILPISTHQAFMSLLYEQVFTCDRTMLAEVRRVTLDAFLVCEHAMELLSAKLIDFKLEFGLRDNKLFIAEPPSFEEWRLLVDTYHLDKEPFRKGEAANLTLDRFRQAALLADELPRVQEEVAAWWRQER